MWAYIMDIRDADKRRATRTIQKYSRNSSVRKAKKKIRKIYEAHRNASPGQKMTQRQVNDMRELIKLDTRYPGLTDQVEFELSRDTHLL